MGNAYATHGLTSRQAELLTLLRKRKVTPSYIEMAEALGLASKGSAFRLVDGLVRRGYVERIPGRARSIRILAEPKPIDMLAARNEILVRKFELSDVSTSELMAELNRRLRAGA